MQLNSINKFQVAGILMEDPEVKATENSQLANARIKTVDTFKSKTGEQRSWESHHKITCWGQQASIIMNYRQGDSIFVEGSIKYGSYMDNIGNKRYTTDLVVSSIFGGSPTGGATNTSNVAAPQAVPQTASPQFGYNHTPPQAPAAYNANVNANNPQQPAQIPPQGDMNNDDVPF